MTEAEKMAEVIHNGLDDNPVQWGAFLIGLQSGYNLAKAVPADREEKKN